MKTKEINNISQEEFPDGVYVIYQDGTCEIYEYGMNISGPVQYVGLKLGSKSIVLALKNAAEDTTLTIRKDKTAYSRSADNSTDAIADWNGKENTDHLRQIGLNSEIKLDDEEYIPAAGELYFINLFLKKINEALIAVEGEQLNGWLWTSTEDIPANAWQLYIGDVTLSSVCLTDSYHIGVRAVAPFNPTKLLKTK